MFTRNEIQPVIPTDKKWVAWQQMGMFTLIQFWSIYRAEWVADIFVPKFYSVVHSNIGLNFGDGLNYVTFPGYSQLGVVM